MTVDGLLAEARSHYVRVDAHEAARRQRCGAWLIDFRPHANRLAEGEIPGAIVVERIVLEWRLDPASEYRLPGLTRDTEVVLICNEGYSSSLAARDVLRLGLRATDLIGGFRAWKAAGLPVIPGGSPAVS